MVVDSSAVLAILFDEPERDVFSDVLAASGVRLMSCVNALEAAVVVSSRKGPYGAREFDLLLHRAEFEGDCCAYALARHSGEPLLFKGDDFSRTDVVSALRS